MFTRMLSILLVCAIGVFSRAYVVNNGTAGASDNNAGTQAAPFLTINKGAQVAQAGDTVLVRAGVYREHVVPARSGTSSAPIVYKAAAGESVFVRASDVWRPTWQSASSANGTFTGSFSGISFGNWNPYTMSAAAGREAFTYGQLFIDGKVVNQGATTNEVASTPNSWAVLDDRSGLLVRPSSGVDLSSALVELAIRRQVFAPTTRDLSNIVVSGFIFEHAACNWQTWDEEQFGMVSSCRGSYWTFENNVFRYSGTAGMDLARANYITVRNNIFRWNGQAGVVGHFPTHLTFEGNVVEYNNWLRFDYMEEAGVKIHGNHDGLVRNNLFRNNFAHWGGLWCDWDLRNVRITRNIFLNNQGYGICLEAAEANVLCDNNIVVGNTAEGIHSHDGQNITIAHNLVYNNNGSYGSIEVVKWTDRSMNGHTMRAVYDTIVNNMVLENASGIRLDANTGNYAGENVIYPASQAGSYGIVPATYSVSLDFSTMILSLTIDQSPWNAGCASVRGVDGGFFGNPYPANDPICGPFQNLEQGVNTFRLWPPVYDDTPPTAAPTGLTATPASDSRIDLSWNAVEASGDPQSGISGYAVYRNGVRVGSAPGTTYSDQGLSEATPYTYEVAAVNGGGVEGPKSNAVQATTVGDVVAPSVTAVEAVDEGAIIVTFSEPVEQNSAQTAANFQIAGLTVSSATLNSAGTIVALTVSSMIDGQTYTLSVSGIQDRAATPNTMAQTQHVQLQYTAAATVSAFSRIEAETFISMQGIIPNGATIGSLDNGDWLRYANLSFGTGAGTFTAHIAAAGAGGVVELHLDAVDGPVIGRLNVTSTGSWDTYSDQSCALTGIAQGRHDLYLAFPGVVHGNGNLDWFIFDSGTAEAAGMMRSVRAKSVTIQRVGTGYLMEVGIDGNYNLSVMTISGRKVAAVRGYGHTKFTFTNFPATACLLTGIADGKPFMRRLPPL